jgi:hypothetical protein
VRSRPFHAPVDIDVAGADIMTVHMAIKRSFDTKNRTSLINTAFRELQQTKHRARIGRLSPSEQRSRGVRKKIRALRQLLLDAEGEYSWLLYIFVSDRHLAEYKQASHTLGSQVFGSGEGLALAAPAGGQRSRDGDGRVEVRRTTDAFLAAARHFAKFRNYHSDPEEMNCRNCGGGVFLQLTDDDSVFVCEKCLTQIEFLDDAATYRDAARTSTASKFTYNKRAHFSDAMKRFQGKQNIDPAKLAAVLEYIRQEMNRHRIVPEQGTPASLTKVHVHTFLAESGKSHLAKHYDDINLIFSRLTGEPCPDISHLEESLYADFEAQEVMYEELGCLGRRNSLAVAYKLYRLLQRRGFQCTLQDFFVLRTVERRKEHDDILKKVWGALGWEWPEESTTASVSASMPFGWRD